jgi:predicted amidohydrolase YtcJ
MLILHHANIFTGGDPANFCEAMAIYNHKIIALGKNDDVLALANRNDKIINLKGKTILPGLTDSHIHLQHTGKSLKMVNCETNSVQKIHDRIITKTKETQPGNWIFGHGWNQNQWASGFDEFDVLKNISNTHPILLTAKSLHACWANPKALEIAGINSNTSDPEGGVIGRNKENSPNGLLFENAMELIYKAVPPLSKSELIPLLDQTQKSLWKSGITSVHDFDGVDCFSALQEMDQEKHLKLRVVKSIPSSIFESAIETGIKSGFGSDFLRLGSLKLFADGALGPQTAAMINPYENDANNFGILLLTKEEIVDYGIEAAKNGISLAIHAIGDRANREVIDAFAEIRNFELRNNLPLLNHRIEHVQILSDQDLGRLSEHKIIASMQPIHLISDMDTADRLWGTRSKNAYAFGTLQNNETTILFGSDSPVESFNPFIGIYAALTRKKLNETPLNGWYPTEKINIMDTINAYTINPAKAAKWDSNIGSLAIDKFADLIVLPENIFEISPEEIKELVPLATMVNGEWVYQREDL